MPLTTTSVSPRHRWAVPALCLGGFTAALTQTMVIPLQSEHPDHHRTTPSSAAWVITITLLSAAVFMPISGRVADLVGKKRVLVATSSMLFVGSVVCAMSSSLAPVLVGRVMQGMAMGFIPVGISLIREISPPEKAGTSLAAMSATLGVGGSIGLPLAAWIAQVGDFHTLFWVSAGAALVIVVLVASLVPHVHDSEPGTFDVVGAIGLAVALTATLVGISKGNDWGWSSPATLGSILGGIVALVVWARLELRLDQPLVDVRTAAHPSVLMTNIAALAVGFGMMAQSIATPQLLQLPTATGYGLGQSILAAGLWMAPAGLGMMLFSPISGRLIGRLGARVTLMVGATVLGLGYLVAVALMNAPWQLLLASAIASAGVGIGYAAMPTLILDHVAPRAASSAVSVNSLMRMVGTTLAAAVMAAILNASTTTFGSGQVPTKGAFQLCFVVGAFAAFVGAAIASRIPRPVRTPTDPDDHPDDHTDPSEDAHDRPHAHR